MALEGDFQKGREKEEMERGEREEEEREEKEEEVEEVEEEEEEREREREPTVGDLGSGRMEGAFGREEVPLQRGSGKLHGGCGGMQGDGPVSSD